MSDEIFGWDVDSPYDEKLVYNNIISQAEGGKEYRYQKWQYPKRIFSVNISARSRTVINNIWNFFQRHAGNYDTFLFEDSNSSSASNPISNDVFATGDGVKANFYIGNKFSLPTGDCHLISGTVTIQKSVGGTGDWTAWSSPTNYTLQESLGEVIPAITLPSGDVLRGTYRFRYRVRFADSSITRKQFAYELWNTGIDLVQEI